MLALAHRFDYVMSIVANIIWTFGQILALETLFNNTSSFYGWNQYELILLLAFGQIQVYVSFIIYLYNLKRLRGEIIEGELDTELIKPINIKFHTSLQNLRVSQIVSFFLTVFPMFLYVLVNIDVNSVLVIQALVMQFLGMIAFYYFSLWMAGLSFHVDNFGWILEISSQLEYFARVPIEYLPKALGLLLTFLIPVVVTSYFPTMIVKEEVSVFLVLSLNLGLIATNYLISKVVWKSGLRKYSGVN